MEIKSRGYADWAHYVNLGYHPNKKKSAIRRFFNRIFRIV